MQTVKDLSSKDKHQFLIKYSSNIFKQSISGMQLYGSVIFIKFLLSLSTLDTVVKSVKKNFFNCIQLV